jgi:hypothetical protein
MIRVRILLAAIKARRGAAAILFVVAVIAIAAAAIGPMFLQSADTSVLTSTAHAARAGQTDVLFNSNGGDSQMSKLSAAAKSAELLAGGLLAAPIVTVDDSGHFAAQNQAFQADIMARSDICAHVRIVLGACPTHVSDVAISQRSAAAAGVGIGTHLEITEPHSSDTTDVKITGIYRQPSKLNDSYWKDNNYFVFGSGTPSNIILDPLVASFGTALSMSRVTVPQLSADFAWRARATLSGSSVLESTVAKIKAQLFSHYGLVVSTGLTSVINAARHDDNLMSTVVLAIVLQLILLSLVILYTLGRATIFERRQESEFARRHGFPRSALIALAIGEPSALIIVALPVGVILAWGTLVVVTKTLFVSGTPATFPGTAIAAAVGACVVGVIAMAIASSDLWRSRTSNGRQTKRVGVVVDAFALALALTGLLSLLTKGSLSGTKANPLALVVPGLLTLAAALIGFRLAAFVIQMFIARTDDSTRVAWFLALRQIGRRPAVLRRLLPLTAATAVLLFAVGSFFLASSNRTLVAHFDVGAARVVDVTPPPGLNFERAVRRADPSGHEAMAVEYYSASTGELLAVDSTRLAAVAFWPASLSTKSLAVLARKLTPRVPRGVSFSGDDLKLTFDVSTATPPIELGVNLFDETYRDSTTVYVGPITTGLHSVTISLASDCPGACRLTGLSPNWENPDSTYAKNVSFALRGVAVRKNGRWHNVEFGAGQSGTWQAQPPSIRIEPTASTCCSVAFAIPGTQLQLAGLLLSPVDLPAATPAIVTNAAEAADAPPTPSSAGNLEVDLEGGLLTIHPLVVVPTLPLIGNGGAMVDLSLAQRVITSSDDDATYQVWLAPAASPTILQRLRADGVVIGPIASASARLGVLNHGGIALAYAVALTVSPIAALLALGTVMFIIVVDGRRRRREFESLSMAGVPTKTIRRAYLLENALVLGIALVLGMGIGFMIDSLALRSLPEFVAGPGGLPISAAVPVIPVLCAVGCLGLLLALVVELSNRSVMRSTPHHDEGSME